MTESADRTRHARLLSRGRKLEAATLGWNVVGVFVLAFAATKARSVALAGFGLDSLVEVGASIVVLWELAAVNQERQRRAIRFDRVRLRGSGHLPGYREHGRPSRPVPSPSQPSGHRLDRGNRLLSCSVSLSAKVRTGAALDSAVLRAEGRITVIDGILATAVLVGLILNAVAGWWWADPLAGYALLYYVAREARGSLSH